MDFEQIFKALGDPLRLRILKLLPDTPSLRNFKHGYNVNQLVDKLQGSQPNVSHHLRILKEAGLIQQEKVRNNVFYYKNQTVLQQAKQFLDDISINE